MKPNSKEALSELLKQTESLVQPLGYEIVALEQGNSPKATRSYTLFIDFLDSTGSTSRDRAIGLDDCVVVNKAVDELFESTPLLEGHYTLEVSSPGVERPLRKPSDYAKFSGRKARVNTFRPLQKEEVGNEKYWLKNQKQKSFVGRLEGLTTDGLRVKMNIDGQSVTIPMELVSKAHLEFENKKE